MRGRSEGCASTRCFSATLAAMPSMPAPLTSADFAAPLSRDDARATVPHLDRSAFTARWRATQGDAHRVLRAFPGLWWRDLRALPEGRVPSARTFGFGDAHIENFGWLAFERGVRFAFNDLDDSGEAEIALDALRYFTSITLCGDVVDLGALAKTWAEGLRKPGELTRKGPAAPPALDEMRKAALDDWKKDAKNDLYPATSAESAAVSAALADKKATKHYDVREVKRRVVIDGGSGGNVRFWALVRDGSDDDVLELKQMTTAGAEQGRGAVATDKRLKAAREALWTGETLAPYHEVELAVRGDKPAPYLVRSRGRRRSWKVEKFGPPRYAVQVEMLASVHARALSSSTPPPDALADWVLSSTQAVAARWRTLAATAAP